jgi:hypothetical protein
MLLLLLLPPPPSSHRPSLIFGFRALSSKELLDDVDDDDDFIKFVEDDFAYSECKAVAAAPIPKEELVIPSASPSSSYCPRLSVVVMV